MSAANLLADPLSGKPFERVAVFRALQLGDLLCATPALRALRGQLPNARITLIGLPWAREFASIYDRYIDDFMEFPGFPGFPERELKTETFPGFLKEVQNRNFELVIQMHGSGALSNSVVSLFGAKYLAGYFAPGQFCPDADRFLPHRPNTHEVWRNLGLVQFLGARPKGEELDYFLQQRDFDSLLAADGVAEFLSDPAPFICLHPGARAAFRCWPTSAFSTLGERLSSLGYRIAVTGGAGEKDLVDAVVRGMKGRAFSLAGKTNLRTLAAFFSRSRLLVCNDTGVSHLAVALKLASVVVFTRSEFLGWPPLNRTRHRVVSRLNGPEVQDVYVEALSVLETLQRGDVSNATIEDLHMARAR